MLSLTQGQTWEQLHVECRAIGCGDVGVMGEPVEPSASKELAVVQSRTTLLNLRSCR
jgi:hypothetical protein